MDQVSAQRALDDIARIEARTAQAAIYGASSAITILWGVVVALANLANQVRPAEERIIWLFAWGAGFGGTALISWTWKRRLSEHHRTVMRVVWAQVALIAFGWLFLWLLPPSNPRQLAVF